MSRNFDNPRSFSGVELFGAGADLPEGVRSAETLHGDIESALTRLNGAKERYDADLTARRAALERNAEALPEPAARREYVTRAMQIETRNAHAAFVAELDKIAESAKPTAVLDAYAIPDRVSQFRFAAMLNAPEVLAGAVALVESLGPAEMRALAERVRAEVAMEKDGATAKQQAMLAALCGRAGRMAHAERPFHANALADAIALPAYDAGVKHLRSAKEKREQFTRMYADYRRTGSISADTKIRNAVGNGALENRAPKPATPPAPGKSTADKIRDGINARLGK